MKARELQAQSEMQKQTGIRQHRHGRRRGLLIGFAAAAAVTVGSVVTVGAMNNWDYQAVFDRYFSEKSGSQVQYDYTGMGLTIGHVISTDDYTLTVQSVMADTDSVYLAYDVELSDAVRAQIEPYEDVCLHGGLGANITDRNGTNLTAVTQHLGEVQSADGIFHLMLVMDTKMDQKNETALSDKQIQIVDDRIDIDYNFHEDGTSEQIRLMSTGEAFTYDLSGITVQQGITVPFSGTLPYDGTLHRFDSVTVTPFRLQFTQEKSESASPDPDILYGADSRESDEASGSYTAVYADGTEIVLKYRDSLTTGMVRNDASNEHTMTKVIYFNEPIPLDGLTGIRLSWSDELIAIA